MNRLMLFCFVTGLSISACGFAEQPVNPDANYWQCRTHDASNTEWTSQNFYQKTALNLAYEQCKKKSALPATCKTSLSACDQVVAGVIITPMWVCTAIDRDGLPWKSNLYPQRLDAALAAQAYCKQKSPLPYTCYMNMVTCVNKNEI